MKKRILVLIICLVTAAAMCLTVSWPAFSGNHGPFLPTLGPSQSNSSPTVTGTGSTDAPAVPPEIRLYACPAENTALYEDLAAQYTALTGIAVTIVTGDLQQLMDGDASPTIFCLHSQQETQQWQEHMYDLSGAPVLEQLYNPNFALTEHGKPLALAMDVTGYGLIYNAALLGKAGFTRSDITDFASLRAITQHITEDRKTLGFYPFCTPDLHNTVLTEYLAGISEDPAQIRSFFDLYRENATASGDPMAQFVSEKIVFYVGGVWDYDRISQLGIHNLDILPIYTADGGSFHCTSSTYWSVNARSSDTDIQASLDFLNWLVTAGENGTAPVDLLGWFSPFRDAVAAEDAFQRLMRKYIAEEPVCLRWEIAPGMTEQTLTGLAAALAAYIATPSDDAWATVAALLT